MALDNILMYGKHPSGKEFTYYIEDQGLEICACDNPEENNWINYNSHELVGLTHEELEENFYKPYPDLREVLEPIFKDE